MAIGLYFAPAAMTADKYNECIKLLRRKLASIPASRM